jgi:NAD(P)H-dependent FMN reductase
VSDERPLLQVIIGSTRPGRVGKPVAEWIADEARAHGGFDVEVVDLAEVALPIFDEPHHPRFGTYEHEHTKRWSATVSRADAFLFVIPEYNYAFNAATKNALDYLHKEWQYKPVGLVTYGGVAAGTRAAQLLKPVLSALKLVTVNEAVNIPFVANFLENGEFVPNEPLVASAKLVLDEVARLAPALKPLRPAA